MRAYGLLKPRSLLTHLPDTTMTDRLYKLKGFSHHTPWIENGKVFLCNDEDGEYIEEFNTREELEAFIEKLRVKADEAWPD